MGVTVFERHSRRVTRTRRWARLRVEALRRDDWRCRDCGSRHGLQVHHEHPVRTHPELAFALDALRTLCRACHTTITRQECGFPPPPPGRREWRASVAELAEPATTRDP